MNTSIHCSPLFILNKSTSLAFILYGGKLFISICIRYSTLVNVMNHHQFYKEISLQAPFYAAY